ncbi:atkY protein [Lactobacillus selangorensis]|uniref:AtkY protein n=1 Tax=Lactobacillus selangorensis TaxID=81857 RepID=A0A0R2G0I6_9LACO|nr:CopY/TcrY family copper transport repressor [Lactobacillus selangorensis]KRN28424.1 atkY protein [Lactobacillus selangorensis]KRN31925.1 atkY protein [Lactobacillus selangorensis]
MTAQLEISDAEWEVMRVVWTLGSASSRTMIQVLDEKMGWKPATVKTLLGRLVKKGFLKTAKQQRAFIYSATITEQDAMDHSSLSLFDHLCDMHKGRTLSYLVDHTTLSQADIAHLQTQLAEKAKTAPEEVACNCLPGDQRCLMEEGDANGKAEHE